MAEATGNHSIVRAASKEIAPPNVDLNEIRNQINQNGIKIPRGEGRESVTILPRPAYYRWEHGINLIEPDILKTRKSPPVFFAVFLMGVGNDSREIRSIRLPVQTTGRLRETEGKLVADMTADGLDAREIATFTPERKSMQIIGRASGAILLSLLRALDYKHFEESAIHPELANPGNPETGRLHSGWKGDDPWPLVIWSNWQSRVCALFGDGRENRIDITGEDIISPAFTQESINSSDPFAKDLLHRILNKNQKASSSSQTKPFNPLHSPQLPEP